MHRINLPVLSQRTFHATLGVILAVVVLSATACGTSTPASPPASPTVPPTVAQPTQPLVQPTAEPSPTAKVAFATTPIPDTPTAARPTAKPTAPPTSKPAALSGRIAYSVVTDAAPKFHTIWLASVDGSGAHQVLTHAYWPALSPDGSRLAYFGRPEGGSEGLYIANADGGNPVLAVIGAGVCCINWSWDGNWVVYAVSGKPNQPGGPIMMIKVDGAYKTIGDLNVSGNGPAFSPDGKQNVYSGCLPNTSTCGVLAVSTGGGLPHPITRDNGGNAHWSPHGDKIVYQATDDAGHIQVFVVNADGSGKKQLTSGKSSDGQPIWSRDGGSILWRSDQNGTVWGIFVMNADGSNPRRILNNVPPDPNLWGWESLSIAP